VWDRAVDGRVLTFHLAGLNHQNFLMADNQTGSWWQQVTGECILGPLKGKHLRRISSEELALVSWRSERPESTVVKFDPRHLGDYAPSDWESRLARMMGPRELIVGIELDGASAAYPLAKLREQNPRNAQVGRSPVLLLVGADGNSVRSFVRPVVEGKPLEFYRRPGGESMIDSATGSVWNFAGKAIAGPLAGRALEPVQNTKDYSFNWTRNHP
jgi:Protein of unknown function (DUF3179)